MNPGIPGVFPPAPRVVVIGDLHGDAQSLLSALRTAGVVNETSEWVASPPNTVVVQLGDQLDAGLRNGTSEDWETVDDRFVLHYMDALDAKARAAGGRVVSLLGNHELMNVQGNFSYVSPRSLAGIGGPARRAELFRPGGKLSALLAAWGACS